MALINNAYYASQIKRVNASRDCSDLDSISTETQAALQGVITELTAQIASLAPLIVAPTDLSSVITWATSMIAPMVTAHTNCTTQLAEVNAQLALLTAAINARRQTLNC